MEWALLASLGPEERAGVLAAARRRRYDRQETVWHEGDLGDTLLLVRTGRLSVRITTNGGERATLGIVGPGEAVGELALVNGRHRRTATLVALERVDALSLGQADFRRLRTTHPGVDGVLVQLLAARVERLSEQLLECRYASATRRVVRMLLRLAEVYDTGGPVVVPLTQEELADLAGTTRPTLNQVLQSLAGSGAVAVSRGRVEVLDRSALRRRSEL